MKLGFLIFALRPFLQGFHPATNNVLVPGGWSIAVEMFLLFAFPFRFSLGKD